MQANLAALAHDGVHWPAVSMNSILEPMEMPNPSEKYAGSAYGRPRQTHDAELTEVGAGTPCGEWMRRYWHPIAVSEKVTSTPQEVRVLGEDLILFRDGKKRPGLMLPRCSHRGASLLYGKVDDTGIRCCYHGWKFDVEGNCLEQPCEPDGGLHKDKARQPWYPVQERYGLVFAYMGPPAKMPVLPRWDMFENLSTEEKLYSTDSSFSVGGDDSITLIPWNWLQDWENNLDPFHVQVLHSTFSTTQFAQEMEVMPRVTFQPTETGASYSAYRIMPDGREMERTHPVAFPSIHSTPDVQLKTGQTDTLAWLTPVDDTNHRRFHVMRVPKDLDPQVTRPRQMYIPQGRPKEWIDMTEDDRRLWPGDWEAQGSQGPITLHSDEHLATSDQGIAILRRLLRKQIRMVQAGQDPIGVEFDPDAPPRVLHSGNFFKAREGETA